MEGSKAAGKFATISTGQSRRNVADSSSGDVPECAAGRELDLSPGTRARRRARPPWRNPSWSAPAPGATTPHLALAWLPRRAPVMVCVPGTGSLTHLEENPGAVGVELDGASYTDLPAAQQGNGATIRPSTVRELPPWRKLNPASPQNPCPR